MNVNGPCVSDIHRKEKSCLHNINHGMISLECLAYTKPLICDISARTPWRQDESSEFLWVELLFVHNARLYASLSSSWGLFLARASSDTKLGFWCAPQPPNSPPKASSIQCPLGVSLLIPELTNLSRNLPIIISYSSYKRFILTLSRGTLTENGLWPL